MNERWNHCIYCGSPNNRAKQVSSGPIVAPAPGDILICLKCGGIAIFNADLRPCEPTEEEMMDCAENDVILQFMQEMDREIRQ